MNKNDLTNMINDPTAVEMAAKVFMAMTNEAQVKEHLEPLLANIITELNTKHRVNITSKNNLYMTSQNIFDEYLDKAHATYTAEGYTVKEKGYCPVLIAESETRKARWNLADYIERYTKITSDQLICSGVEFMEKYIKLNLQLFAQIIQPVIKTLAAERR